MHEYILKKSEERKLVDYEFVSSLNKHNITPLCLKFMMILGIQRH